MRGIKSVHVPHRAYVFRIGIGQCTLEEPLCAIVATDGSAKPRVTGAGRVREIL